MSSKRNFFGVVLIVFLTSLLSAQVNFQHVLSLNLPAPNRYSKIIQLLDYNNDGNDETIVRSWDNNTNRVQIIVYDQSGTIIHTISMDEWIDSIYEKLYLVKENDENHLLRATLDFDTGKIDFIILDCETTTVLDSLKIEPINSHAEPNSIDSYFHNGKRICLVGTIEFSFMEDYSERYYLYKLVKENDTLSYAGCFNDCGICNTHPNDNTLLSVGKCTQHLSGSYLSSYYLQNIDKDAPYNQVELHATSGSMVWESKSSTYYHYPENYDIITRNCIDNSPQVLQYRELDTEDGTSVHFKAYDTTDWQNVWSKTNTEIGMGDITASTCIKVNEEDHYVMYFRGDKLEIRNRLSGSIIHQQDSVLAISDILRKSDDELLFFVKRDDGTGYDVYTLDGPIFVSNDEPQPQNEFVIEQYPNPFRNTTTISFDLSTEFLSNALLKAEINIYNIKGQLVRTISSFQNPSSGTLQANWDGKDKHGQKAAPGVYLYQLLIDEEQKAERKCLLIE